MWRILHMMTPVLIPEGITQLSTDDFRVLFPKAEDKWKAGLSKRAETGNTADFSLEIPSNCVLATETIIGQLLRDLCKGKTVPKLKIKPIHPVQKPQISAGVPVGLVPVVDKQIFPSQRSASTVATIPIVSAIDETREHPTKSQ